MDALVEHLSTLVGAGGGRHSSVRRHGGWAWLSLRDLLPSGPVAGSAGGSDPATSRRYRLCGHSIASVARLVETVAAGALLLLTGCGDRLVELPTERQPAVPVLAPAGPVRCPADTVLLSDDDPASGAGAVPAGFDGRLVLRCEVDLASTSGEGDDRVTVRQWQAAAEAEFRTALDLPDRELRPVRACAAGTGTGTAVYLVDARRQVIRVLLPRDDPCSNIRAEVVALLPANGLPAAATFWISPGPR